MMVARGIAQVITHGSQRNTNLPADFGLLGNLTVFGTSVKLPVVLMAVLVAVAIFIEKKTVFGRLTYWIGSNRVAARLSGIDNAMHVTRLYLFSAAIAGAVGILLASEFKSGLSARGTLMEFDALVISLLGGVAIARRFRLCDRDVLWRADPGRRHLGGDRPRPFPRLAVHAAGLSPCSLPS